MRVGKGEPIYWYAIGTVYTYPDGKPVLRMEGIDAARLEPQRLFDGGRGRDHACSPRAYALEEVD